MKIEEFESIKEVLDNQRIIKTLSQKDIEVIQKLAEGCNIDFNKSDVFIALCSVYSLGYMNGKRAERTKKNA